MTHERGPLPSRIPLCFCLETLWKVREPSCDADNHLITLVDSSRESMRVQWNRQLPVFLRHSNSHRSSEREIYSTISHSPLLPLPPPTGSSEPFPAYTTHWHLSVLSSPRPSTCVFLTLAMDGGIKLSAGPSLQHLHYSLYREALSFVGVFSQDPPTICSNPFLIAHRYPPQFTMYFYSASKFMDFCKGSYDCSSLFVVNRLLSSFI